MRIITNQYGKFIKKINHTKYPIIPIDISKIICFLH